MEIDEQLLDEAVQALIDGEATPQSEFEVSQCFREIKELNGKLDDLDKYEKEAIEWARQRKLKVAERIDFVKSKIDGYLKHFGLDKVRTHEGRAHYRTTVEQLFPDDAALIEWAKEIQSASGKVNLIRVTEKPDMKSIKSYIKSTGDIPPTYEERSVTTLVITREG